MKVIILCGGFGTRLSEETVVKPKPMVEVGGIPILKHIMDFYNMHGHNDFYMTLGYKGDVIKNYFINYNYLKNNITVDSELGIVDVRDKEKEKWQVHLINTGINTMTGGRIKRLKDEIGNETFMVTYGDGLCDVDINNVIKFHRSHGKIATVTAVRNKSTFGIMNIIGDKVKDFKEKPNITKGGLINGGFFVFEPEIFDFIESDSTVLESATLHHLSTRGQLMAYIHDGFWQCMDTYKDKILLDKICESGNIPWKVKRSINKEVG